ncbi:DUF3150 domain-containing protein [Desulfovibrio cuneatus]|uniref:DUF3150 domain-containing protein n=1 Tax=Desulfovibrio cuneatus TaxID=159728 RepID=UPI0004270599|nr:DUF3150 domain-containing protein [Desulfovibrio cuneatus]
MTTNITVLQQLLVVNLDVHIWSARKKLTAVDLSDTNLPPEELASLGSKRICNPEELRAFSMLKARAISLLERNGIRFLSGWAVPEAKMDAISNELASIGNEFRACKEDFLQRYDKSIQEWIAKHPQWASMIASSTVSEEYVRSRMDFRWQVYRVEPASVPAGATAQDSLQEDVGQLGNTLFKEVAGTARDIWQRCYAGKTEITRKALSPLKSLYDKLMGLTFVEPCVAPVAALLEAAFASIPRRGGITGHTLVMLQGVVCLLQNPDALREHGQSILEGNKNTTDVLNLLCANTQGDEPLLLTADEDNPTSPQDIEEEEPLFPQVIDSQGLW